MATNKNAKIEISIAGEKITLTVPFDEQDSVRECESEINALYADWRRKFPRKTISELLAMIAYRYASVFKQISRRYALLGESLSETLLELHTLSAPADSETPITDSCPDYHSIDFGDEDR